METEVTGEHYDSHELLMEYANLFRSRNDYKGVAGKYKAEEVLDASVKDALKTSDTLLESICKANGFYMKRVSFKI